MKLTWPRSAPPPAAPGARGVAAVSSRDSKYSVTAWPGCICRGTSAATVATLLPLVTRPEHTSPALSPPATCHAS